MFHRARHRAAPAPHLAPRSHPGDVGSISVIPTDKAPGRNFTCRPTMWGPRTKAGRPAAGVCGTPPLASEPVRPGGSAWLGVHVAGGNWTLSVAAHGPMQHRSAAAGASCAQLTFTHLTSQNKHPLKCSFVTSTSQGSANHMFPSSCPRIAKRALQGGADLPLAHIIVLYEFVELALACLHAARVDLPLQAIGGLARQRLEVEPIKL